MLVRQIHAQNEKQLHNLLVLIDFLMTHFAIESNQTMQKIEKRHQDVKIITIVLKEALESSPSSWV